MWRPWGDGHGCAGRRPGLLLVAATTWRTLGDLEVTHVQWVSQAEVGLTRAACLPQVP